MKKKEHGEYQMILQNEVTKQHYKDKLNFIATTPFAYFVQCTKTKIYNKHTIIRSAERSKVVVVSSPQSLSTSVLYGRCCANINAKYGFRTLVSIQIYDWKLRCKWVES